MKFNFDLLADILEDTFNIVICLHMVVSTIPLCTSTYQMLLSFARLEKVYISTFLTYFCLPLCTLCGYCYTDECLIEEIVKTMMAYLKVVRTFKYVSLGSEVLQFSSFVQHDMGMSGEFTKNQSI
ncbi:odorant receptor 13a-like [Vespula squamosa]|uniref:Odorant receptor 13a-like n=1 Tax=Vespula squamosa TaxID=30214 RepID=A0ABD1ZU81_VESSQ